MQPHIEVQFHSPEASTRFNHVGACLRVYVTYRLKSHTQAAVAQGDGTIASSEHRFDDDDQFISVMFDGWKVVVGEAKEFP